MKDPHWYAVQVSDTTMLPMAVALPGQYRNGLLNEPYRAMLRTIICPVVLLLSCIYLSQKFIWLMICNLLMDDCVIKFFTVK